jgi:hypothetical protein
VFGFIATPCVRCTRDSFPAWRGAFCGLARCLGREYGNASRLLVNRDAAFIGLLGISLDPGTLCWKNATCCNPLASPFPVADDHPAVLHAAAVSVCGLAAKLADDSRDEGFVRRSVARMGRLLTGPAVDRAVATLNSSSFPTARVLDALEGQEEIEASDPMRADQPVAEAYGTITSHLADLLDIPNQRPALRRVGAALGSLVYWRDAWQDRREDQARGRFNPFETQDHEGIRGRIASSWEDFGSALGELPFVRHGDLIAQIQVSTGHSRETFLQLQTDEEAREKTDRERRKKKEGSSWWEFCDCCDCCECVSCPRIGKGGCCDAAFDCGPGDTGCCDCNPCDGCDCCSCH